MERRSVEAIVTALDAAGVRYLIVGGVAVVAHGFVRFTVDLDLVLDPDQGSLRRAVEALSKLGYRPRVPVPFESFADPAQRASWRRDKGMMVFSLISDAHRSTEVDLFLESPFDFEAAYAKALRVELLEGVVPSIVSREDLLALKRAAGRPRDLEDIRALETLPPPDAGSHD